MEQCAIGLKLVSQFQPDVGKFREVISGFWTGRSLSKSKTLGRLAAAFLGITGHGSYLLVLQAGVRLTSLSHRTPGG